MAPCHGAHGSSVNFGARVPELAAPARLMVVPRRDTSTCANRPQTAPWPRRLTPAPATRRAAPSGARPGSASSPPDRRRIRPARGGPRIGTRCVLDGARNAAGTGDPGALVRRVPDRCPHLLRVPGRPTLAVQPPSGASGSVRIPVKPITHSGRNRSPVPVETDHPFRPKPITRSEQATRDLIMSRASLGSSRRRSAGLSHGVSLHVRIRSLPVDSATGRLRFYPCPLHNDGDSAVDADCNRGTAAPVRRTLPESRPVCCVRGVVVDGRDAPSRPGRKAHNCHLSRGAGGVSPEGP